jgi:hypothetical protein
VITLDALVVNVALPAIGRDLGSGMTELLWVCRLHAHVRRAAPARDRGRQPVTAATQARHEHARPEKGGAPMTAWTSDELDKIGAAEELELASLRRDGTLRKPVTVWVVRRGDDLYVRSYKGRTAAWFRGAQARHEGRIRAGGVDKDVTFVDADGAIDDHIDNAYRTKYRRYGARFVNLMVSPAARAATIKLVPRAAT